MEPSFSSYLVVDGLYTEQWDTEREALADAIECTRDEDFSGHVAIYLYSMADDYKEKLWEYTAPGCVGYTQG